MSLDLPPVTPIWRESTDVEAVPEERPLAEGARLRLALLVPALLIVGALVWLAGTRLVPEPLDIVARPLAILIAVACVGAAIICGAVASCGDVPSWWVREERKSR